MLLRLPSMLAFNFRSSVIRPVSLRWISYVQGQSPEPKIREYFYFIDHQGQLFLDDSKMKNFTSCFKEKDFLVFFFKRIRVNKSGRYEEDFPYVSLCGRERNFIRCDDVPIVFTHILEKTAKEGKTEDWLSYAYAGDRMLQKFEPTQICMFPETGRVYHPAVKQTGGVGLIKSSLAIELSKLFAFENGEKSPPTHFKWKGTAYELTNELWDLISRKEK